MVKKGKIWTEVPVTDYFVTYVNNVNKGKASVLITGDGNRAVGSAKASFAIGTKNLGWFRFLFQWW